MQLFGIYNPLARLYIQIYIHIYHSVERERKMEGKGGGGPGWGRRVPTSASNRPFALQLSVWGVRLVSRGPRKMRGAHLDSL